MPTPLQPSVREIAGENEFIKAVMDAEVPKLHSCGAVLSLDLPQSLVMHTSIDSRYISFRLV